MNARSIPVRRFAVARRLTVGVLAGASLLGAALAAPAGAQDLCFDRADHDGDGMGSYAECNFGTDPLRADTDSDGLIDPVELFTHNTNPRSADTDGDGLGDWFELNTGSDPLVNGNVPAPPPVEPPAPTGRSDRDGDGLYDDDETVDGVNAEYGTNPDLWDTDGDGVSDGGEVSNGTDPNDGWDN